MDGLPQLTQQNFAEVATVYCLVLLLSSSGGPALPGSTLRLCVPHHDRVETSLPEVHPSCYLCPNLPGPMYAQRL